MKSLSSLLLATMMAAAPAAQADLKDMVGDVKDRLTNPGMSKVRINQQINFLKTQQKSIKKKRKQLKKTLTELLHAENDVNIMSNLMECLEAESGLNAHTYNVIADDSMRDRRRTVKMFDKVNDHNKEQYCDTSEFSKRARTIKRRTKSSEKTPDLYLLNRSDLVVYSEQDVRDLFDYYIDQHARVILLYENFAREIGVIENVASVRMQQMDIPVDPAIISALSNQQALSLTKVMALSKMLLDRGGENGKEPLYSFSSIDEFNILTRQNSGADKINVYLPSLDVDGMAPYSLNEKNVDLRLPETFRFSQTAIQKAKELGNVNLIENSDQNIEASVDQAVEELLLIIEANLIELKEFRKMAQ